MDDRRKKGEFVGALGALLVHVAVIALLILVSFTVPQPDEDAGGVPVMLGNVESARGFVLAYTRQRQIRCTSTTFVRRKTDTIPIPVGLLYLLIKGMAWLLLPTALSASTLYATLSKISIRKKPFPTPINGITSAPKRLPTMTKRLRVMY